MISHLELKADIQLMLCWDRSNGSNADKAPFLNLSTVQPATPLSSLLCAISHRWVHPDEWPSCGLC